MTLRILGGARQAALRALAETFVRGVEAEFAGELQVLRDRGGNVEANVCFAAAQALISHLSERDLTLGSICVGLPLAQGVLLAQAPPEARPILNRLMASSLDAGLTYGEDSLTPKGSA